MIASAIGSTSHRLFAAIDFDVQSRAAIGREQNRLRSALGDALQIKWVRPEQVHLTLVFLAAVPDELMPVLTTACGAPIAHPAFTMTFGGVGVFPPQGAPRVVWMGAVDGTAGAAAVQRIVAARVEELRIPTESRRFSAHVTLGRCRNARPADRARLTSWSRAEELTLLDVREIVLYESHLSSSGSTYLPVARAPLAPAP